MKSFFKRNQFSIVAIFLLVIIFFCYMYKVSAYTYESLDFKYGKVIAKNYLNIRCGPGTNYEKVGKLKDGECIDVFAKIGDWYIIQTSTNIIGTVSSRYIEPIYDEENIEQYKEEVSVESSVNNKESSEYIDNLELTSEELEFLNLINSNRKNHGLVELKIDNTVQNIARLKAQDLERNGYFSHQSPSYGSISDMLTSFGVEYQSTQENIAGNQNLVGAVEAWMNSESHKSNILNNDFEYTGVGVVNSATYGKIFVEVFVKK